MRKGKRYELYPFYKLEKCGFNLFKIKAYIEGKTKIDGFLSVSLLLDTGASFTMINPKIIENLGYSIHHTTETIKVTGLGGKKTD